MRSKFLAVALVSAVAFTGCKKQDTITDETESGLVDASHIGGREIETAVKDLAGKISEKNGMGWPEHIKMSSDNPPKPVVRIANVVNRTRQHFDLENLKNEIYNVMLERDVVYFAAQANDLESVNQERDYSQSGMTNEAAGQRVDYGQEDAVGLVLAGEITDDKIEVDGATQYDYWFNLRLVDTVKNRPILTTRTKMRRMREK
jgi:PBP1b-binding outer membrane lipoprotein LpoB